MTDTTIAAPAASAPTDAQAKALAAVDAAINSTEFQAVEQKVEIEVRQALFRLHEDWKWIVASSWSLRFVYIAFLLSAAEAGLPFFVGKTSINPVLFALIIAIVTGAAFVARLMAQNKGSIDAK